MKTTPALIYSPTPVERSFWLVAAILSIGWSQLVAGTSCAALSTSLVSWWRAEGNGEDFLANNSGVVFNGLGFAAGEVGQAFDFRQANQYLRVPSSASLNVGASSGFTIEAWIRPTDVTAQHPIAEWNNGSGFGVHFWHSVAFAGQGGPGCLYANVVDASFNGHFFFSPTGLLSPNIWQHVALTYDKPSGQARLSSMGRPS